MFCTLPALQKSVRSGKLWQRFLKTVQDRRWLKLRVENEAIGSCGGLRRKQVKLWRLEVEAGKLWRLEVEAGEAVEA